jgi:hypothetical protein
MYRLKGRNTRTFGGSVALAVAVANHDMLLQGGSEHPIAAGCNRVRVDVREAALTFASSAKISTKRGDQLHTCVTCARAASAATHPNFAFFLRIMPADGGTRHVGKEHKEQKKQENLEN